MKTLILACMLIFPLAALSNDTVHCGQGDYKGNCPVNCKMKHKMKVHPLMGKTLHVICSDGAVIGLDWDTSSVLLLPVQGFIEKFDICLDGGEDDHCDLPFYNGNPSSNHSITVKRVTCTSSHYTAGKSDNC